MVPFCGVEKMTTTATKEYKTYKVHVAKQFPAWDEKDGFDLEFSATSKSQAIRYARRQMNDDGHTGHGMGRAFFTATVMEDYSN